MSKVICDVCGTTYPETASVCPICGCAKNTTEQTAADSAQDLEGQAYAPMKGGRFSKANVRRRNKAAKESRRGNDDEPEGSVNKGLVAVVLILLLAIIAVLVYIGARFLFPNDNPNPSENTSQTTDPAPSGSSEPSGSGSLACTEIKLSSTTVELTEKDMVWMLSTEVEPKGTTDKVSFESADPNVASVDENGKITAVGGGETVITVRCGEQMAQCKVKCSFGTPVTPTTDPTNPTVTVPAGFKLTLRHTDITISEKYPDPVALFRASDAVKATDITWTVDNPQVAAVSEGGVVSAVGKGNTIVRATIGDQTATCKIVVAFDPAEKPQAKYKLSHRDVTLEIGGADTFSLNLLTEENANVQNVQWTASEEGYVEINGSRIKAIKSTQEVKGRYIVLSATIEDYTYSCIVRITEKEKDET